MKHNGPFDRHYYTALVKQTRRYGSCYVHAAAPSRLDCGDVLFSVSGYGRSLQSGGHKYKVHARSKDGKPVFSKNL